MSICERLREELDSEYVNVDEVIDNLDTASSVQPLSANQGVVLNNKINNKVPILVKSAIVKICEEDDDPVPGYEVGDKYIEFVINDDDESVIYCLLTEITTIEGLEITANKTSTVDEDSTDGQYPSAKAVYDYHDSSKLNESDLDTAASELGFVKTTPVQSDYEEANPTSLAFIQNKPDIDSICENIAEEVCRNMLKEYFVGRTADVSLVNGILLTSEYEEGDFDDS